jgi:hypothetical protein
VVSAILATSLGYSAVFIIAIGLYALAAAMSRNDL